MISISLCDDNLLDLEKYKNLINSLAQQNGILVNIHTFKTGEQLLFHCSTQPDAADLIYMDVIMKPINGIQTVKKLKQLGCTAEVIYLSASEDFVFESFDTAPLHYIVKNSVTELKFEEIFLRAVNIIRRKKMNFLTFEAGSVVKKIPTDSILYFEIQNRVVSVYYDNESFRFYSTMASVEEMVKNRGFVRIHRSYIINLKYVITITKTSVVLSNDKVLPLGVTYTKLVSNAFFSYLMQKE